MVVNPDNKTAHFLQLLGQHERALRAFVLSLVPHWDDAEEILQRTRVRLWEQFDQYDPAKNFGGWSRTIAQFQILALRERLSRYPEIRDAEYLETVSHQFEATDDAAEERQRALRGCLDKLEQSRRNLVLRYYSGKETMAQLAGATGRTLSAIEHAIRRTRVALSRCIEKTLHREGAS